MKPGYAVLGLLAIAAAGTVPALAGDPEPPLKQLAQGVPPDEILCAGGKVLVQAGDRRPACVSQDTAGRMQDRGWILLGRTAGSMLQGIGPADAGQPVRNAPAPPDVEDRILADDPALAAHAGDGPIYSSEPAEPLFADTRLSISNIPKIGETAVITLETTYPETYLTDDWEEWDESWEGDYPWKVKYHPEVLSHANRTQVGLIFPTSWEILDLDRRLNEPKNMTNEYGNTYQMTYTQLAIETGRTYNFTATIRPTTEGHMGVSGQGFLEDELSILLSIGKEKSLLNSDYLENNETYLSHLEVAGHYAQLIKL